MGNGTSVLQGGFLWDFYLPLGRWHRSKDKVQKPTSDFGSYMVNKKWMLEEQFNIHMMRFQQVMSFCYSNNLKPVIILGWIADE